MRRYARGWLAGLRCRSRTQDYAYAEVLHAAAEHCGPLRSVALETPHKSRRHVRFSVRGECCGHARIDA